jgi:peroxiredoxin Q/BCP
MAKIDVGDTAPDFELPGTGGKRFRLSDYVGEGGSGVILAFYPGDFTEVCTKQFCAYRDDSDRLDALGVPTLGISPQPVMTHEAWAQELGLKVPLLADEDMQVAKSYGVRGWASPLAWLRERRAVTPGGWFVQRSIFVVDGEGIVRYRHADFLGTTYQSVDDLEEAVAALA